MSVLLIATFIVVGCDVLLAVAIPVVKFLYKRERKVKAEDAATSPEKEVKNT